jgi:hypothetical protein
MIEFIYGTRFIAHPAGIRIYKNAKCRRPCLKTPQNRHTIFYGRSIAGDGSAGYYTFLTQAFGSRFVAFAFFFIYFFCANFSASSADAKVCVLPLPAVPMRPYFMVTSQPDTVTA